MGVSPFALSVYVFVVFLNGLSPLCWIVITWRYNGKRKRIILLEWVRRLTLFEAWSSIM